MCWNVFLFLQCNIVISYFRSHLCTHQLIGKPERELSIRFALSPEECGLLVDQLPKNQPVEFLRWIPSYDDNDSHKKPPNKLLVVTPGQAGMASFKVDFEKDGVGAQPYGPGGATGPLEVILQAGELQVVLSLMKDSIPYLLGWNVSMDIAQNRAIATAMNGGVGNTPGYGNAGNYDDNAGGGGRGGGPTFSTSDGRGNPPGNPPGNPGGAGSGFYD